MNSRPLSILIPWNQQQQQQRPASIQSSSSNQIHSPSWSSLSLDLYSSNSSDLEDKKKKKQKQKAQQAIHGFSQMLLLSLNDCSLGFYRISEHIHRKVPRIVETKKKLRKYSKLVDIATSDIEDVRKSVCDIERIESFYNMTKMIEKSILLIKK